MREIDLSQFNLFYENKGGLLRVVTIRVKSLKEAEEVGKQKQPRGWKLVKIKEMTRGQEE